MSSLGGDNHVELVGAIDRRRETTCHRIVRTANVGDDTVKNDRCLLYVVWESLIKEHRWMLTDPAYKRYRSIHVVIVQRL